MSSVNVTVRLISFVIANRKLVFIYVFLVFPNFLTVSYKNVVITWKTIHKEGFYVKIQ